MAVLSSPLLSAQQRWDLEDYNALISGLKTDSHYYIKRFLSSSSYILKGFTIASGYIGQAEAEISLSGATLINGDSSGDFSWYTAEAGASNLTVAFGSGNLEVGRNYIEVQLGTQNGTPLQRAFWDPTANGGEGVEFNQTTNTMKDLTISVSINQSGFNSGDPDYIPIAIIDVDSDELIAGIQDRRKLFFRLGSTDTPGASYSWGSQTEPTTTLSFETPSSNAFVAGETITFSSGATATVVTGGTDDIEVFLFSNTNYNPGDTVTGGTSSGSGTLATYYASFTGGDKDIGDFRQLIEALETEIKTLKGTDYWFEAGNVTSLKSLMRYVTAQLVGLTAGARFSWSGTELSITDDASSGQASNDELAAIRTLGDSADLTLTRQDGTGGSAAIGIADGSVLYVEIPNTGDRTFSEAGSGSTNFKTATRASFTPLDTNFVLAYREGSKLVIRGLGELDSGESVEISDQISDQLLAFLGATSEADSTPSYSSTKRVTDETSLTTAISALDDAVADAQEDRSAFLRSDAEITWTGTQLEFTSNIILEIINTKSGTTTLHTIASSDSPIAIADGEVIWVEIDRTEASETLTVKNSGIDAIPAQAPGDKDVFILFKRIDVDDSAYLHLPFTKQVLNEGQTVRLGASGAGGAEKIVRLLDHSSSSLPTGESSLSIDGVSVANGDYILFTNLGSENNRVYEVSGVGSSTAFTAVKFYADNSEDPSEGESVRVTEGNRFGLQLATFDGTDFKVNNVIRAFDGSDLTEFWEESALKKATLSDNTSDGVVFSATATGNEAWIIEYSINRDGDLEVGHIYMVTDGTDVSIVTTSAGIGSTGVTFSADIDSGNIRLLYDTNNTGDDATLKYSYKKWTVS